MHFYHYHCTTCSNKSEQFLRQFARPRPAMSNTHKLSTFVLDDSIRTTGSQGPWNDHTLTLLPYWFVDISLQNTFWSQGRFHDQDPTISKKCTLCKQTAQLLKIFQPKSAFFLGRRAGRTRWRTPCEPRYDTARTRRRLTVKRTALRTWSK